MNRDQYVVCAGKRPVNPLTLANCDPHDPANWLPRDVAEQYAATVGGDVGFVFTDDDPYFLIDLDHHWDGEKWSDWANYFTAMFLGAYVEVSSSGDGLHIIGSTSSPVPDHGCKNKDLGIELYHTKRLVRLTGDGSRGDPDTEHDRALSEIIGSYFTGGIMADLSQWRDAPVPNWSGPTEDDELIRRASNAKGSTAQALGKAASFTDLFTGNVSALAQHFPQPNKDDAFDRSSADFALAAKLAFWTGGDHARIERIMRVSALRREKWDKHKNYLRSSIVRAVSECTNFYTDQRQQQPPVIEEVLAGGVGGFQLMTVEQQLDHFKGCVYISEQHRVLIPNGTMLKPEAFKSTYGGYAFAFDTFGKTDNNAFKVLTESQCYRFPKVSNVCFRPELPSNSTVDDGGRTLINTYVPLSTERKQGDPSPFLNHIRAMMPTEHDYEVVIAYIAAMVQHKGTKFQWCPILQGVEGNGKSLISRALMHSLGERYVHLPNASDLSGNGFKFNGWIEGKLAIVFEEIYTEDNRKITEPMKVLISNERLEIQHKGTSQYTGDNRANILGFTNHRDAVRMNDDMRRYFFVYTLQQSKDDLVRAGMTDDYFVKLYNWAKSGGYAIINEFLHSYHIPAHLNPAGKCQRAPDSSTKADSITEGYGVAEQLIMEAVEEGRQGFRGGWISSHRVKDILPKIGPKTRGQIVENLGYVKHPGLRGGRVNTPIGAEGAKPILYVLKNTPVPIEAPDMIRQKYESDQGYVSGGLQVVK